MSTAHTRSSRRIVLPRHSQHRSTISADQIWVCQSCWATAFVGRGDGQCAQSPRSVAIVEGHPRSKSTEDPTEGCRAISVAAATPSRSAPSSVTRQIHRVKAIGVLPSAWRELRRSARCAAQIRDSGGSREGCAGRFPAPPVSSNLVSRARPGPESDDLRRAPGAGHTTRRELVASAGRLPRENQGKTA